MKNGSEYRPVGESCKKVMNLTSRNFLIVWETNLFLASQESLRSMDLVVIE